MAFLDWPNTVATKRIVPGVTDGVFRNSVTLAFFRRNSLASYAGGPNWQENILYDAMNGDFYKPGDTFDISQLQVATGGTVTPRYLQISVSAQLEKLRVELAGPEAVVNYLDVLFQDAALTASGKLSTAIYRHGQDLSGSLRSAAINGLDEALSDGTTNGYDGRTYPSYLTLTRTDVNGALNSPMVNPAANVAGPIDYPTLERGYQSVTIGSEKPDLIVTTNDGFSFIKMAFESQKRFETTDPDFGFHGIKFNGATILADQYAPGSRVGSAVDTKVGYQGGLAGETLWILNTKYFRFYLATDPLYAFGFTGFVPAQGTSTVAGRYSFCGNFTCQAPRLSRQLFGITT